MAVESKLHPVNWSALLLRIVLPALGRGLAFGAVAGLMLGVRYRPDPLGPLGDFTHEFSWHGFWGGFVAMPLALLDAWGRYRVNKERPSYGLLLASYFVAAQWVSALSFGRGYPELALEGEMLLGALEIYEAVRAASSTRLWFMTTIVLSLGAATSLLSGSRIWTILVAHGALLLPDLVWGHSLGSAALVSVLIEFLVITIAFYSGSLFFWRLPSADGGSSGAGIAGVGVDGSESCAVGAPAA